MPNQRSVAKVIQMPSRPNPNPTSEQVELFRLECLDEAGYFQPPDHLLGDVFIEPSGPNGPVNHGVQRNDSLLQWRMPLTVSGFLNTDAMNFVDCEMCHQPAGKVCTDHRGKNSARCMVKQPAPTESSSRIAPASVKRARCKLKRFADIQRLKFLNYDGAQPGSVAVASPWSEPWLPGRRRWMSRNGRQLRSEITMGCSASRALVIPMSVW